MTTIYRLLTGNDDSSFCHKVTKALSEGWELYGSPQYATDPLNSELRCAQAVTKRTDEQYDPERELKGY